MHYKYIKYFHVYPHVHFVKKYLYFLKSNKRQKDRPPEKTDSEKCFPMQCYWNEGLWEKWSSSGSSWKKSNSKEPFAYIHA